MSRRMLIAGLLLAVVPGLLLFILFGEAMELLIVTREPPPSAHLAAEILGDWGIPLLVVSVCGLVMLILCILAWLTSIAKRRNRIRGQVKELCQQFPAPTPAG